MDTDAGASGGLETLSEAFAELVETTLGEFDVHELLQVLVDRCVDVLGVAASGLMLADEAADLHMMVASDDRAKFMELFQIQHDEGPCLESYRSGEMVVVESVDGGFDQWPRFGPACADAGFTNVTAVPMRVNGRVIGGLNLFGTAMQPGPSMSTARIAQAMAKVVAITIEKDSLSRKRVTLIEQLETALESRVVIEQAKGILANHLDIGVNDAFALLRERARGSRRLLREVAGEVVKTRGSDYRRMATEPGGPAEA
jgi:GAF domain-containing protein